MEYSTFGKHIIVDLWGVDFSLLDDMQFLEYHLVTAADYSGAHVLNVSKKEFQPYGVTVLVLLSESHLSIHTYPEQILQLLTVILAVQPLNHKYRLIIS
ncbi:S-adenosylmethionine decarboxylase proenzyme 2 [Bacillus cereus]|nr:S-adenosylmethionine decarboxylase proenzyme 2 [Bacillus cereus]